MELHYNINSTMRSLADRYFVPSIPSEFTPVEHRSEVITSGNFAQDGFYDFICEKIDCILNVIECSLDNQIMLWTDVDIIFHPQWKQNCIPAEIRELSEGYDLLFQREWPHKNAVNTGVMAIRRNTRALIFFAQVRIMLETFNRSEQASANKLLQIGTPITWGLLPDTYSSETNRGLNANSRLYHANNTSKDSMNTKQRMLDHLEKSWAVEGRM